VSAGAQGGEPRPAETPSEEELRAAYEAELGRITAVDMIGQAAVSLMNIAARRLGPGPGEAPTGQQGERDLEQAGDAIDGARALLAILERRVPGELGPLRDALSKLQLAYAAEARREGPQPPPDGEGPEGEGGAGPGGQGGGGPGGGAGPAPERPPAGGERRPGPAESSGRLWVPGR
jgi:hypothetical protein